MTEFIKKQIRDSAAARWAVLILVSIAMMSAYFISDLMSPLKTLLELHLGWDAGEYGVFTSGYALFNVWLFMLIFGGMLLDRMGIRFTGVTAIIIMLVGTLIKYLALTRIPIDAVLNFPFGWQMKSTVFFAMIGFGIFGIGIEIVCISANKAIVKWFQGKEMATAIGMNTAMGRIGTALAFFFTPQIVAHYNNISSPLLLAMVFICIGLMFFLVFCVMDSKLDKEIKASDEAPEEPFKFKDIKDIVTNNGFWFISILCVLFYIGVFSFLKFAPDLMFQKFGIALERSGYIPALLPMGTILLTPFFGNLYDRKGRGATIMVIGSALMVIVHALFSVPSLDMPYMAIILTVVLGIAFSLVPSAMWPSVAKIIPMNKLGTAYSMIFWVQNVGLWAAPMLIGHVLNKYCITGQMMINDKMVPTYDYTLPMMIFTMFAVLAVIVALMLKRSDSRNGYGLELPNIKK